MKRRDKQSKEPSYNELDGTDESLKAEDIARAGSTERRSSKAEEDCEGETPQRVDSPCAPDGKNADRYAG